MQQLQMAFLGRSTRGPTVALLVRGVNVTKWRTPQRQTAAPAVQGWQKATVLRFNER